MSNDTPRTDAAIETMSRDVTGFLDFVGFAHTLERELSEANATLGWLQNMHACSREMVSFWCERAAKAAKEISAEQQRLLQDAQDNAERYRLVTLKQDAEIAQLRAEVERLKAEATLQARDLREACLRINEAEARAERAEARADSAAMDVVRLETAIAYVLDSNGGPTEGDDGLSYVLVRSDAFESLNTARAALAAKGATP